jgi:hypothetical protein
MLESYFRNNADLGTGLLMARFAVTSPHFFLPPPDLSSPHSFVFSNFQPHSRILAISPPSSKSGYPEALEEKSLANVSDIGTVRTECPTWRLERR